jgi:adenylate cyclase class IV
LSFDGGRAGRVYYARLLTLHSIMAHLEIEIKSLLGEASAAHALKEKLRAMDPDSALVGSSCQLNHYFDGGDIRTLLTATESLFSPEARERFARIVELGTDFSVRTRQKDTEVLLVVKASVDGGTSSNTVSRLEFEEVVQVSLEELDGLVEKSGYHYQAKWSRSREEYTYRDATVCIDKNAGYGYLAEFEKVVTEGSDVATTRASIEALMAELGVFELPQDRLARMFDFYNRNWAEYYGTEKTFVIE